MSEPASPFAIAIVGISEYDWDLGAGDRTSFKEAVETSASLVRASLENLGGLTPKGWQIRGESRSQVNELLNQWMCSRQSSILYWVGHGRLWMQRHELALSEKKPNDRYDFGDHWYSSSYLAKSMCIRLNDEDGDAWSIILLNSCNSAKGAQHLQDSLVDVNDGWAIVGVSDGHDIAKEFPEIVAEISRSRTLNDTVAYTAGQFVEDIRNRLHPKGWVYQRLDNDRHILASARRNATTAVASFDDLSEVVAHLAEQPGGRHFSHKAFGMEIISTWDQVTWGLVDRLNAVLDGRRLVVVTGEPGVGKSALLGQWLIRALNSEATKSGPVVRGVHLAGMTLRDALQALATVFDRQHLLHGRRLDLPDLLEALPKNATLVLDALDESREPLLIARAIVGQVQEDRRDPGKVIVGTRRTKTGAQLLRYLPDDRQDEDIKSDPKVMADYAQRRLGLEATFDPTRFEGRPFLRVRLAVEEVRSGRRAPDEVPVLVGFTPQSVLDGVIHDQPIPVLVAMAALALAKGRGYPRAEWLTAARSLSRTPEESVTQRDIDEVLRVFGAYVMTDSVEGVATYRLGHREYIDVVRSSLRFSEWRLGSGGQGQSWSEREWESRITLGFLDELTKTPEGPIASSYLQRHLLDHIEDAALWQAPKIEEALSRLPPDIIELAVARLAHADDRLPQPIRNSWGRLESLYEPLEWRRNVLAALGHLREPGLPDAQQKPSPSGSVVRWGRLSSLPLSLVIGERAAVTSSATRSVRDVRFVGALDGVPLLEINRGSQADLWAVSSLIRVSSYEVKADCLVAYGGRMGRCPTLWMTEGDSVVRRDLLSTWVSDAFALLDHASFVVADDEDQVIVGDSSGLVLWFKDRDQDGSRAWELAGEVTEAFPAGNGGAVCFADSRWWVVDRSGQQQLEFAPDETTVSVARGGPTSVVVIAQKLNGDSRLRIVGSNCASSRIVDLGTVALSPFDPLEPWAASWDGDVLYLARKESAKVVIHRVTRERQFDADERSSRPTAAIQRIAAIRSDATSLDILPRSTGSVTVVTASQAGSVELWHPGLDETDEPKPVVRVAAGRVQTGSLVVTATRNGGGVGGSALIGDTDPITLELREGGSGDFLWSKTMVDLPASMLMISSRRGPQLVCGDEMGNIVFIHRDDWVVEPMLRHPRFRDPDRDMDDSVVEALEQHGSAVTCLSAEVSETGLNLRMASAAGGEVFVWDVPSRRVRQRFELPGDVLSLTYAGDCLLALCRTGQIWRHKGHDSQRTPAREVDSQLMLPHPAGDQHVLLIGPSGVQVLDVESGELVEAWSGKAFNAAVVLGLDPVADRERERKISVLALLVRDGVETEREVRLIDVTDLERVKELPSLPLGRSKPICLDSDGTTLYVGCDDGVVALDVFEWCAQARSAST